MLEINSSTKVRFLLKMKVKLVMLIQTKYPKLYEKINVKESRKWKANSIPWTPLKKPLNECHVALVTSGGIILKEQEPFDLNNPKGDCSYREIPHDATLDQIVISHMYYDHSDVKVDTEVMFPLETLKRFQSEGIIGSVNSRHYSFSGGIDDPTSLIEKTGPEVARNLVNDQVDLVILTPAWGYCHRSVGLIANELEKQGISTIMVTLLPDATKELGVPRAIYFPNKLGSPIGRPNNKEEQYNALQLCFDAVLKAKKGEMITVTP